MAGRRSNSLSSPEAHDVQAQELVQRVTRACSTNYMSIDRTTSPFVEISVRRKKRRKWNAVRWGPV